MQVDLEYGAHMEDVTFESEITCPHCGAAALETMPENV